MAKKNALQCPGTKNKVLIKRKKATEAASRLVYNSKVAQADLSTERRKAPIIAKIRP